MSTATTTTTSSSSDLYLVLCTVETLVSEICAGEGRKSLYLQFHGDLVRRFEPAEWPLQMVYDYLSRVGFDDPLRMQEEATNPDLRCMLQFYGEKPCQMDHLGRILLSGINNVQGKDPVAKMGRAPGCSLWYLPHRFLSKGLSDWEMHILPLVGGKVEEVKQQQFSLVFYLAGAQAQTYHVSFESLAEYQTWPLPGQTGLQGGISANEFC